MEKHSQTHHVAQVICWLENAIYAIEKADYQASEKALAVARIHLEQAAKMEPVRQDA